MIVFFKKFKKFAIFAHFGNSDIEEIRINTVRGEERYLHLIIVIIYNYHSNSPALERRVSMKIVSSSETLEIISKQWCNCSDFMILSHTGKNKALRLMNDLRSKLMEDNYYLPSNVLPMDKVVDYLDINIPYLEMVKDLTTDN